MYGGLRVTLACHKGEVKLIDSKVKSTLPSSLKVQLVRIYGEFSTKDRILVSRIPCQQQKGALDCGFFSIATAYHMAQGDGQQRFDQSLMRQHLMACFEKQALSPFPHASCWQETLDQCNETSVHSSALHL